MFAFLPIFCFLIFSLLVRLSFRESFLIAATIWGVTVIFITEFLSLFHALTFGNIVLSWFMVFTVSMILVWRLRPFQSFQLVKYTKEEIFLLLTSGTILVTIASVAFWAPPNNWDSLTTHMARVAHWAQNKTLDNYPTSMVRQLNYPPWATYAILHFQILTQTDRFANFIQYFSMVGSVLGTSLIAAQLGAPRLVQIMTGIITISIPMGILQATSTQNDYVVAFWLVCFTNFVLLIRKQLRWCYVLAAGGSLGLAWMIKGTGYIYALPFLVWLLWSGEKTYGKRFITRAVIILAIAVSINLGFYSRNMALTGTLIPPSEKAHMINLDEGWKVFASNIIRNVALQIGTPLPAWNRSVEALVYQAHQWIGIKVEDPSGSMEGAKFAFADLPFHEDHASNLIHLILIVGCGVGLFFMRNLPNVFLVSRYFWAVTAGFIAFNIIVKWSPYNNRYHLPLFVLYAPFIGIILSTFLNRRFLVPISLGLLICALPWVLINESRPLLGPQSVLKTPRMEQYFANNPGFIFSYLSAMDAAQQADCSDIGLILGGNTWEYPLWVAAKYIYKGQRFRLEHVEVQNESAAVGYPLGPFNPCIILHANTEMGIAIVVNHRPYIKTHQYAFFSTYLRFDYLPPDFQRVLLSKLNAQ